MQEDTVVRLPRPGASIADDPLLEVLRSGARRMLQQVIEAEVEAFLGAHADLERGEAAQAQEEHLVLWDQSLARALDRMIVEPEGCNPYARSANSNAACADADAAFSQYRHLTDLDHIALFVDRYANARFNRQIAPGTRVAFRADVPDVLRQKADFKVQLKVKF